MTPKEQFFDFFNRMFQEWTEVPHTFDFTAVYNELFPLGTRDEAVRKKLGIYSKFFLDILTPEIWSEMGKDSTKERELEFYEGKKFLLYLYEYNGEIIPVPYYYAPDWEFMERYMREIMDKCENHLNALVEVMS